MIDLNKTTLIIPIKIEHQDRYRNAKTVLNFLNSNLSTNVFIFEVSEGGKSKLDFLSDLDKLNIKHWCIEGENTFHRTKYLNIMLDEVQTPVVVNYDIDVVLRPGNFLECQNSIINGNFEVIYPYELGNGQIMVLDSFDYSGFKNADYKLDFINQSSSKADQSAECGHCIFFNTAFYKKWGGENEEFISYGPEDKERMYRFKSITEKISWREGEKVYHFEHFRGNDSWVTNPNFNHNWGVFEKIKAFSIPSLLDYYSNAEYSLKYKTICK